MFATNPTSSQSSRPSIADISAGEPSADTANRATEPVCPAAWRLAAADPSVASLRKNVQPRGSGDAAGFRSRRHRRS